MTNDVKLVVKALRWCADVDKDECGCSGCPREYEDAGPYCRDDLDACAADLIERLTAEIDALKESAKGQLVIVNTVQVDRDEWKSLAEKLGQEVKYWMKRCEAAERDIVRTLRGEQPICAMCDQVICPEYGEKEKPPNYCDEAKWRGPCKENGGVE